MSIGIQTENGYLVMSFAGGDDLLTNVITSLEIEKGSWFAAPEFGMLKRSRMKNTDRTARLIEGDIRAALQWLLDSNRATAIDVVMERDTTINLNRLIARISVTGSKGNRITYEKFMEVV